MAIGGGSGTSRLMGLGFMFGATQLSSGESSYRRNGGVS